MPRYDAIVVGGGPAGSFFAIHLLREAKRLNLHLDVVIVEKRGPTDQGSDDFQCKGCNFCAGLVSPRLSMSLSTLSQSAMLAPPAKRP